MLGFLLLMFAVLLLFFVMERRPDLRRQSRLLLVVVLCVAVSDRYHAAGTIQTVDPFNSEQVMTLANSMMKAQVDADASRYYTVSR